MVTKLLLMKPNRLIDCLIEDGAGQAANSGVPDIPGLAGSTRDRGSYQSSEQTCQIGQQGTSSGAGVAEQAGNGETPGTIGMLICALIYFFKISKVEKELLINLINHKQCKQA